MAQGAATDGSAFTTLRPYDPQLVNQLIKAMLRFSAKPEEEPSLLMNIFISWFPMLLLIGVWVFFMRQMQGGGKGRGVQLRQSRAQCWIKNKTPSPLLTSPVATKPKKSEGNRRLPA